MHPLGKYARFGLLSNEKPSILHILDDPEGLSDSSGLSYTAVDVTEDDGYGVQVYFDGKFTKSNSVAILIREHCGDYTALHGTIVKNVKHCVGRLDRGLNGEPLRLARFSEYWHSTSYKIKSFPGNIIMGAIKLEIMLVPVDILERTGKKRSLRFLPENVSGISGDIERVEGKYGESARGNGSVRVRWMANINEPIARAQVFIPLKDHIPNKSLYLCNCRGTDRVAASPGAGSELSEHNNGAGATHENALPSTTSTASSSTTSSEGRNDLSHTNPPRVKEEQDDNTLKRKLLDPIQQPTSTSKYRILNNGSKVPQSSHRKTMNDQTNEEQIKQEHHDTVSKPKASGSLSVVKDEPAEESLPIMPPIEENQENTIVVNDHRMHMPVYPTPLPAYFPYPMVPNAAPYVHMHPPSVSSLRQANRSRRGRSS
ncbi:hypothetical protein QCA50_001015 [Cerrena zonata]|uniref:Uncharacterized protein n=1 Tax=Cerrena zonata TaxID=2478898 RepID=A0AAW0H0N4_9APHY